ncbi:MAG TPA: ATP-binding protein [Hyphomonadaceae bacterium]|nr:ATP-binding protein [Hyphomonadaceae bacterium]
MSPTNMDVDPIFLEAIENLPDGISIFDANGVPLLHNHMSEKRFPHLYEAFAKGARHYKEALAYTVRQSRPDFNDEQVAEQVEKFNAFTETGDTYEQRTPDGRIVQVTYRPMSDGRKVAISVDVTDLRQREKELKKAQQAAVAASNAKSAFLANMSHEIRTPLNGILGMAQVLEMGGLSSEQREQVQTILDSGRNLMALLNDVLDLSKIEAGKIAIVSADTDLTHTLRRLHRLWKPKAEESGLEFYLSLDADLPQVLNFDAVRVRQCVSNLISNAIKFTSKGRVEVFVTAKRQPDGQHLVKIRVSDTGVGMDEETMGRLFRPFTQADDSTSRKYGGTGLGLSITRSLAELMGGEASVRSEIGRGSEFTFSFLAGEAAPQHRVVSEGVSMNEDESRSSLKNQNLRLLLVDDHPINRQVASLFLRPFNMRIVEATNGREALAALEHETFDVVLLDVHMPVMDGTETIRAIRASGQPWANLPVIALTADAMTGDKERYLGMGMDGYMSKPIAERDLITEISRVRSLTLEQLAQNRQLKMVDAEDLAA